MGLFDQMKMAQEMMKNMSPDEIKGLMEQAKEAQGQIADQVAKLVEVEIKRRNLISRDEVIGLIEEQGRKIKS